MKLSGKEGSKPRAPVVHAFDHAHWDTARRRSGDRIETSGLADKVVRRIGQDVISGLFKPGDTLPNESALCERLGVSRSVLREAVRVLVSKGLLLRKSRLGTRVCPTDAWSLLDSDVLGWLSAETEPANSSTAVSDTVASTPLPTTAAPPPVTLNFKVLVLVTLILLLLPRLGAL